MRRGFTLIEIMVVIGSLGVIMAVVMGFLSGTFKASNRIKWGDIIEKNGSFALNELRRNILNGEISNCNIGVGNSSIVVTNKNDGLETTLLCDSGKIASVSATTIDLTNTDEVIVSNCDNFVSCSTSPSTLGFSEIDFNFNLSAGISGGGEENFVSRDFNSQVTVRD